MGRVLILAVGVLGGGAASFAGAARTGGIHRFFEQNASPPVYCEVAAGVPGLGTFAYCLTAPTPAKAVSVQMTAAARLEVCHGVGCMSNPPETEQVLRTGASMSAGPFRCTSTAGGVRCLVTKLGHGFLLGPHGLTKV